MTPSSATLPGAGLSVAVRTDTGKVRSNNEDSFGTRWLPDGRLLVVVADGMGGHEAGEVASRLAVDVLGEQLANARVADPRERMHAALLSANEAIIDEGRRAGRPGMGTTAVTALIEPAVAWVGLVGDSRLFHVRRGHVLWRTRDHTRVQGLIDRGVITQAEARTHADVGMLTRALGHARMSNGAPLEPDVLREPLPLQEGDALVLCSDGCHDLIDDDEIGHFIAGCGPEEAADRLVTVALDRGGHDNVTVAVVTVGERAGDYDPGHGVDLTQDATLKEIPMPAAAPAPEPPRTAEVEPLPRWFYVALAAGLGMLLVSLAMLGLAVYLAL